VLDYAQVNAQHSVQHVQVQVQLQHVYQDIT